MQYCYNCPITQGALFADLPPLTNIFQWTGSREGLTGFHHDLLTPLSFSKSKNGLYLESMEVDAMNGHRNVLEKRSFIKSKKRHCRDTIEKQLMCSLKNYRKAMRIVLTLRKSVFLQEFKKQILKSFAGRPFLRRKTIASLRQSIFMTACLISSLVSFRTRANNRTLEPTKFWYGR